MAAKTPRRRGPDKKPRKRRTDNPRPPGKPKGTKNALPMGAVSAIRALRWRVPEDAPDAAAELAGEAFETVVAVMRGSIMENTRERLTASRVIREEICGPITQRVELDGKVDIHAEIDKAAARAGVPDEDE